MPKVKSDYQGKDGGFYLVNPAGAIHSVTKEHATARLRQAGWRLAEDAEIEVYLETPVQRYQRPICERWTPVPEVEEMLPEVQDDRPPEATEDAAALAAEHNIDLATVTGTGAGARILVKDIRAVIGEDK